METQCSQETEADGTLAPRLDARLYQDDDASIKFPDGSRAFYRHGKLVMFVHANGTVVWYLNDVPHREDGPAVVTADCTKMYFRHGIRHRADGAAVERPDGRDEYWLNGVRQRQM